MALQTVWVNEGKPLNGVIEARIVDGDTIVSVFKGRSEMEVADRILASSAQAAERIRELKGSRQPDKAAVAAPIAPRPLTNEERFAISTEMMDPDKAPDAIERLVTTSVGASPQDIGAMLSRMSQAETQEWYRQEALAFAAAHPSYYADPQRVNQQKLFDALVAKGYDLTRNNLAMVYDELSTQGLLIEAPAQPQPTGTHEDTNASLESNPPRNIRPRSVSSTGFRDANASATRPPAEKPPALTRADIDKMGRAAYAEKLRDPKFRAQVDALPR